MHLKRGSRWAPLFFFPLELEYQELARSEDKRVAYHVIVLYTEFIV